ncbi:MAG: hypothetical protein LBC77_00185 [Spirochaetaceae bacterium]|jgi:hypothetical protein|nr:hypothetical protein [Spirochaetaceae bacterium]
MKRFCLVLAITIAASCSRKSLADDIILQPSPPLSRSVIGYGVITTSYTHIYDRRGYESETLGILRKGTIVEILERRPVLKDDISESWVFATGSYVGWLRESAINVYPSRSQAETASGSLKQ